MKVIQTDEDVRAIADATLESLVLERISETSEYVDHFSELVRFVLIDAGDSTDSFEKEVGFGIGDGGRGIDAFEDHSGYFELVYVVSDDGSGLTVFVNKEGISESFNRLCASCGAPGSKS